MLDMPIITYAYCAGSVYVINYINLRSEVLRGAKLITISPAMEQKRSIEIAARLLENLDMP